MQARERRILLSLLATAVATLPGWSASGTAAPSDPEGSSLLGEGDHSGKVTARLLADVEAVGPDVPFMVGIEITMQPGWHTYWENGGDAGLPTTVEWELPDGWEASDILWPVPHRYEEEGDLVTFGYADRVLLRTEITPRGARPGGEPAVIRGVVDWLQCKDICIPGGAKVEIRLPVEEEARPAHEKTLATFAAARERNPRIAADEESTAVWPFQSLDAIPPGDSASVAAVFEGLEHFDVERAEFFPRPSDVLWFRDATFRSDEKNLGVVIPVEVDASVEAGSVLLLPGVLEIPRTDGGKPYLLSLDIPVTVAEEGQTPEPVEAPVFAAVAGPLLPVGPEGLGSGRAALGLGALARYLVLAFLGGIILNVMPCVLPVISLKILGFVSKSDEDPRKVARLGFVFAGGVIASFLVLALAVIALQAAGEHIGWGFQFQNPAFVAGLAVVVFVFSLSLLGVFEIDALAVVAGRGIGTGVHRDYADAFFHGILTTVLATPCTAPMLGTAIAFAFSQPPGIILLVFLAVAVGLALPYVLLSMHPGWLRYMPKPGPWMDTFKQGMGFVLLATLVWLLFVFGAQTGADGLVWLLAFLLVVGFFTWMQGRFLDLSSSRTRVTVVWLLTIAGVGWSYHAFLHEHIFGVPDVAYARETPQLRSSVDVSEGGIIWEPFSVEYLEERVADGNTVFIDFTADWCWTCKVNEKTVLASEDVERVFRENRVVTLKGDWTRKDPEITEILRRHRRAGVPFYAVYPAGRPEDVIVLPEIINKKLVLESLERAGPSIATPGA
jgi:thiol:disulfide interchange protein DsbD